jgi:hypothetical protein
MSDSNFRAALFVHGTRLEQTQQLHHIHEWFNTALPGYELSIDEVMDQIDFSDDAKWADIGDSSQFRRIQVGDHEFGFVRSNTRGLPDKLFGLSTTTVFPSIRSVSIDEIKEIHNQSVIGFAEERLLLWEDEELHDELERILQHRTRDLTEPEQLFDGVKHTGGRPPLGTTVAGGELKPGEDYHRVCDTLRKVVEDKLSHTEAATILNCNRKTVRNAIQKRSHLYESVDPDPQRVLSE